MRQRIVFTLIVVILGFSGGVLALFVRGLQVERGAVAGFCFVSGVAIVQAWMVASGIDDARRLYSNVRKACYQGVQAKFRTVFLVGLCTVMGGLPVALIGANLGAEVRFATVTLGGVMFSTASALTVLPVVIARSQSEVK